MVSVDFPINPVNLTPRCWHTTALPWRMRYIARAIEERGTAAVIILTKWDAVPNKDGLVMLRRLEFWSPEAEFHQGSGLMMLGFIRVGQEWFEYGWCQMIMANILIMFLFDNGLMLVYCQ